MKIITLKVGPLPTNCYIVLDEKGNAVVIDPGSQADLIKEHISKENAVLTSVLLTHAHFDHICGFPDLESPKTFLHKEDIPMLTDNGKNAADIFGFSVPDNMPSPTPVADGDKIPFGDTEFYVMHTPGHSLGSCIFLLDSVIFSGDTLFAGGIGRTDCYGGSPDDMLKSLKRIYALPKDYKLLPGHGEASSLSKEKAENPYLFAFGNGRI